MSKEGKALLTIFYASNKDAQDYLLKNVGSALPPKIDAEQEVKDAGAYLVDHITRLAG